MLQTGALEQKFQTRSFSIFRTTSKSMENSQSIWMYHRGPTPDSTVIRYYRHRKVRNVQSAANFQVIDTKKPLEHEQADRRRNQQLAGFIFQRSSILSR